MQVSTCRKCKKPTPLEELASDEMCTSCCQEAYGLSGVEADWDLEAENLFRRLNLHDQAGARSKHNDLDPVWQHPTSGARLFIGNRRAASTRKILKQHGINCVVNCQDLNSANPFEGKADMEGNVMRYWRMDVQEWPMLVQEDNNYKGDGVLEYFAPCFAWMHHALTSGDSVLVHCYAGAHRAGTVGTAFLMHTARLHLVDALRLAQRCRPIVNPFARLLKLLSMLDRALSESGHYEGRGSWTLEMPVPIGPTPSGWTALATSV